MSKNQYILGLITDLFFVTRSNEIAKALGYETEWLDVPEEPSAFIARLQNGPPALIVLDLNTSLPWPHWIRAAKADAATAAVPWLAFGSHMNPRRLAAARHAGADKVVPKSQFDAELRELLTELTKPPK